MGVLKLVKDFRPPYLWGSCIPQRPLIEVYVLEIKASVPRFFVPYFIVETIIHELFHYLISLIGIPNLHCFLDRADKTKFIIKLKKKRDESKLEVRYYV